MTPEQQAALIDFDEKQAALDERIRALRVLLSRWEDYREGMDYERENKAA